MSRVPLAARVCILTIALLLAALPAVSNAATDCPHKAGWRPNGAQLKLLREGHKSGFQEENLDLPEGTERGAFCNIDLKGETLNTANLSGYDLRGADFTGAALFAVDLSGADLAGAKLRGADLSSASLAGTDLRATILSDAKLHRADLNGANLDKVEIYGVDISGAKLIRASLREAHLIGADLSGSNLTDADLAGAKLDKTRLVGARLHRTNLRGVTLRQTVASGADFYKVDARGAVFTEAELDKAAMIEANLAGADFSGASLRGAQLIGATVAGGSFFWADLLGADLSGVDLTGVDLRGANLKDTKLFDARLDDADLRGADLSGATLTQMTLGGAKLADADLTGAVYQPDLAPAGGYLTGLRGLETVRFAPGKSGALVRLRALLREAGLRDLERAATFAIEGGITRHALTRGEKDVVAGVKGALRLVLFEWTTGYGFYPLRALVVAAVLALVLAVVYAAAIARDAGGGIYRLRPGGRIDGGADPTLTRDVAAERLHVSGVAALRHALYFSVFSALHIGWRDIAVDGWLARLQPRGFVLRATGWVRVVSSAQSLISLYLLGLSLVAYFGRPFE